MLRSLPSSTFKTFALFLLAICVNTVMSIPANAQCGGNLLVNGSFESPVVPIVNGNNIMGPGVSWGGWNCTNGGLNILRVSGSGYASGANHAAGGFQYVDVANSDGYISQAFTLAVNGPIYFSGSFSNREMGWSSYVNWTGRVEILDANNVVVATSRTRSFFTTDSNEIWYTLTGATSSLPAGNYTYRAYAGNSGHFDNAAVCALSDAILPVKLKSFTTTLKGGQVQANWQVGEENNVKGYELQYSLDGISFKTVNFIQANQVESYTLLHITPAAGVNYYRLVTVDFNGMTSYSTTSKVIINKDSEISLYPNPSKGKIMVTLNNGMQQQSATLLVLSTNGTTVFQKKYSSIGQNESIDLSSLKPGTYFLRITGLTGSVNKTVSIAD